MVKESRNVFIHSKSLAVQNPNFDLFPEQGVEVKSSSKYCCSGDN